MKIKILGLLIFGSVISINAQETRIRTLIVADAKIACQYNNTIMSCLKVKPHRDSSWKDFPYTIEGFIFEPGVETEIEIEETPIAFPDSSGQKYTYKMTRVLSSHETVLRDKRLLAGGKWKLINIELDQRMTNTRKSAAYIQFDIDSNLVSGFGGCNSFGGNTMIENGVLQFGILNSTVLSCSNDQTEKMLFDGLKGKAAFYIRNNMLFVVCENRMNLHLRPEKKLDSLISELNKPVVQSRGNTYGDLRNGQFMVTLDELAQAGAKELIMKSETLKPAEKQSIRYKLINTVPDGAVAEVLILTKPHKIKGNVYATVILRDGSKHSVVLKNVL